MEKKKTNSILRAKYFWGIGSLVARQTGYSVNFCRDVLKGKFEDRNTPAVREIKKAAKPYKVA
jgi:hypothetical protein